MWPMVLLAILLGGSNGTILYGVPESASSESGPTQPQPVISIASCNKSESIPVPQYQIGENKPSSGSNYFVPTILNRYPSSSQGNGENEDYMDIGNRIQSQISSVISNFGAWSPPRVPTQTRLPSQNSFLLDEQVQNTMNIENNVKFYLFTKRNPMVSQELQLHHKNNVNETNFSPVLETKLIFHGFTDVDAPGEWVNVMKETYLGVSDVNLIVADFSSFPLHNLVSSSLPIFASRRLTEFITFLSKESGAPLDSFHIIARSYACHIVGISGRKLGGKLGRITALEPSPKITAVGSPDIRLAPEHAQFVDVIHVNGQRFFFHGSQFGLVPPMGHVDVYPNSAERGLGCPGETGNFRRYGLRHCHLGRGVRYFTKSIRYPQLYPMCQCASYEGYKAGLCSCHQRNVMTSLGMISPRIRGVFQLAPLIQQNPTFNFPNFANSLFG